MPPSNIMSAMVLEIEYELMELMKAWAAISLAFGIIILQQAQKIPFGSCIAIAALTVGLGFVAHELCHRYFARKFGKHAEFKANNLMLLLAIVMSFLGFVLAAPGAVIISGFVTRKEGGILAASGPAANLALAVLFIPFLFIFPTIAYYGLMINAWLALFNLIPFPGFDGHRVIEWSKPAYVVMLVIAIVINVLHIILPNITHIIY
jgi:Zn-dependent protease